MIDRIAGSSHSKKTLLAQRLLEHRKIPCLSQDHLKMGLIRSKTIEQRADDAINWAELLRDNRRLLAEAKRAGASYLLIDEAYPDEKTLLAAIQQA